MFIKARYLTERSNTKKQLMQTGQAKVSAYKVTRGDNAGEVRYSGPINSNCKPLPSVLYRINIKLKPGITA